MKSQQRTQGVNDKIGYFRRADIGEETDPKKWPGPGHFQNPFIRNPITVKLLQNEKTDYSEKSERKYLQTGAAVLY